MKYIRQFVIIMLFTFLGEILKAILPFSIPASIYGLLMFLIALETRVVSLEAVQDVGEFFIEIMPLTFIPAGVGLMESWGILKPMLGSLFLIIVLSTLLVMTVSGLVTQTIIRHKNQSDAEKI